MARCWGRWLGRGRWGLQGWEELALGEAAGGSAQLGGGGLLRSGGPFRAFPSMGGRVSGLWHARGGALVRRGRAGGLASPKWGFTRCP